jgi:hypothetical protein
MRHSANRAPLMSEASPFWPARRPVFYTSRRTSSSASLAHGSPRESKLNVYCTY